MKDGSVYKEGSFFKNNPDAYAALLYSDAVELKESHHKKNRNPSGTKLCQITTNPENKTSLQTTPFLKVAKFITFNFVMIAFLRIHLVLHAEPIRLYKCFTLLRISTSLSGLKLTAFNLL